MGQQYVFRYFNPLGGLLRIAMMTCTDDERAIETAYATMSEPFDVVEVWHGEQVVFIGGVPANESGSAELERTPAA